MELFSESRPLLCFCGGYSSLGFEHDWIVLLVAGIEQFTFAPLVHIQPNYNLLTE